MKINHLQLLALFLLNLFLFTNCGNNNQNFANNDSLQIDSSSKTEAYNYNDVLKLQDSLLAIFTWPNKLELDLNDDGVNEEFQAVEGYSRGMGYALFSKVGNNWKLLSGNESIGSGHLGVNKLDKKNNGWHDFVALQPSGRNGIIESYYTWNGKIYKLTDQKEIEN